MKKILMLATAAFLVSGVAFAHDGDKVKGKEKEKKTCTKANGKCCGKSEKSKKEKAAPQS
jgi:hypothetical protein